MPSFSLTLNFGLLGNQTINGGQSWLINTGDSDLADAFFDWLEAIKYYPEASIEYTAEGFSTSDLYIIRKYFKTLRFRLTENESDFFYYQQRYNAAENDYVQTVGEYIGSITDPFLRQLAVQLGLERLYREKINMLSTGEFRKAFVLKASIAKPGVMFLDEPYTGVDSGTFIVFNRLFSYLVRNGSAVVIFTSTGTRPDIITHILNPEKSEKRLYPDDAGSIEIPEIYGSNDFKHAFELRNITASYYGRDVLHDVSWSVRRGEKWSLTGHNGAGKSTLLSFVYADNPQVYCNNVSLFDWRRGSGESIWEIKDRIGFYSSELHRYFNKIQTIESAINSIIFQNPYEKRLLNASEEEFRRRLLKYFNLDGPDNKLLCELSAVNQKLVILTAMLVKNAPLLILDEPFQGFSEQMIQKCLAILVSYVKNRTFIMVSHNNSDFPGCINRHFHLVEGKGSEIASLPLVDRENNNSR
jgi:molybdate transport system ATP-binding protein